MSASGGILGKDARVLAHSTSIRMPWRQDLRPRCKPGQLGAKASGYLWNAQVLGTRLTVDLWDRLVFVTDYWLDRVAAYECDAYA